MGEAVPVALPSFDSAVESEAFRPELDFGQVKDAFVQQLRAKNAQKERRAWVTGKERLFDHRDPRIRDELFDAMASAQKMARFRERIISEHPNVREAIQMADVQQRIADHIISQPKATLEQLRKFDERFAFSGPLGLAAAVDVLGRSNYEVFYPDPLLDALYKVDLVAFDPQKAKGFLFQIKTADDLIEPYILASEAEFQKRSGDIVSRVQADPVRRPEEEKELGDDLEVLRHFTSALNGRYREQFTPMFLAFPSLRSAVRPDYFDSETGLPKRDFPSIILDNEKKGGRRSDH